MATGFRIHRSQHGDSDAGTALPIRSREARPFLHLLGGLRYDSIAGDSNTAWGGQAGGGVDLRPSDRAALRLGADFQLFFDNGENVKTLRPTAGFTF
jgi:hypothetical protein